MSVDEAPPVSEKLKVLDYVNLYKTGKWWSAVALIESFGRRQVALYLWLNKDGKWKRQQKFVVRSRAEWGVIKENVEKFSSQLS